METVFRSLFLSLQTINCVNIVSKNADEVVTEKFK